MRNCFSRMRFAKARVLPSRERTGRTAPPGPPVTVSLSPVAGLTGLALGWLTVHLAGNLHRVLAGFPLGLGTGLGTGLAYAFCNLPAVFNSSPTNHAWISAAGCLVGMLPQTTRSAALGESRWV